MARVAGKSFVPVTHVDDPCEASATHLLYCEGPVLEAAQRLRIWPDSKDFVDTATRAPASVVLKAWAEETPSDDASARAFIEKWFECGPRDPDGAEGRLGNGTAGTSGPSIGSHPSQPSIGNQTVSLPDWAPDGPPFAAARFNKYIQITRGDDDVYAWAREFASNVHALWPLLTRLPTPVDKEHSTSAIVGDAKSPSDDDKETTKKTSPVTRVSTALPLPHNALVPGSRFRETYYWDSYWVVVGLVTSGMTHTAQGVALNLLSLVSISQ